MDCSLVRSTELWKDHLSVCPLRAPSDVERPLARPRHRDPTRYFVLRLLISALTVRQIKSRFSRLLSDRSIKQEVPAKRQIRDYYQTLIFEEIKTVFVCICISAFVWFSIRDRLTMCCNH
jgi:hypothetical protein